MPAGTLSSLHSANHPTVLPSMTFVSTRSISSIIPADEHVYQSFRTRARIGSFGDCHTFGNTLEVGDGYADIRFKNLGGMIRT